MNIMNRTPIAAAPSALLLETLTAVMDELRATLGAIKSPALLDAEHLLAMGRNVRSGVARAYVDETIKAQNAGGTQTSPKLKSLKAELDEYDALIADHKDDLKAERAKFAEKAEVKLQAVEKRVHGILVDMAPALGKAAEILAAIDRFKALNGMEVDYMHPRKIDHVGIAALATHLGRFAR